MPRNSASRLPTVVLPAPIGPTRKMLERDRMRGLCGQKQDGRPEAPVRANRGDQLTRMPSLRIFGEMKISNSRLLLMVWLVRNR